MQLSNTWKATVGLMIGAILCLPAQAAAEKKIIMRYSHSSAAMVEEPHHTAALDFKKYVEEKTKGRVEVQIYPASQLGGEERAFQDVQQGVIQIASLASNNAAVFAPPSTSSIFPTCSGPIRKAGPSSTSTGTNSTLKPSRKAATASSAGSTSATATSATANGPSVPSKTSRASKSACPTTRS